MFAGPSLLLLLLSWMLFVDKMLRLTTIKFGKTAKGFLCYVFTVLLDTTHPIQETKHEDSQKVWQGCQNCVLCLYGSARRYTSQLVEAASSQRKSLVGLPELMSAVSLHFY